jgi:biopolymer transport protein ExbD
MSAKMRARRMARNHKRLKQQPKLNLVALMDIFTILVLFLMVNNGDVEVLQPDPAVLLPESLSELRPELALTIKVGEQDIIVEGRPVQNVAAAIAQEEETLAGLALELDRHSALSEPLSEADMALGTGVGRAVIIMGDRAMPYKLLKRVMATCAQKDYRDISLAVDSRPEQIEGGVQIAARDRLL